MSLLVVPIFVVSLALGVETWTWRIAFAIATIVAFRMMGPAWVAVPVVLIIGIGLKNSLDNLKGSSMPPIR
jgi:hypothetical protein